MGGAMRLGSYGRHTRSPSIFVLALMSAFTVIGVGTTMALAGPPPPPPHDKSLDCDPHNPNLGGGCQITFKDENESKGYGGKAANANQQVCFTVNNPGDMVSGQTGNCSLTDSKGNAFGLFQAGVCGSATITGTEGPEPGEPNGTQTGVVTVVGGSCSSNFMAVEVIGGTSYYCPVGANLGHSGHNGNTGGGANGGSGGTGGQFGCGSNGGNGGNGGHGDTAAGHGGNGGNGGNGACAPQPGTSGQGTSATWLGPGPAPCNGKGGDGGNGGNGGNGRGAIPGGNGGNGQPGTAGQHGQNGQNGQNA